jgi:zinc protease
LTWDDAKAFYDRWYGPNNAILVVTGDVTGDQVLALAQTIYGPIPKTNVPERKRPLVPPLDGLPELTMRDPLVKEPMVQTTYRVPGSRQNKQESLALQVLQEIMSGGSSARLYRILVAEQKIATDAGLSYSSDSWDDGRLSLYTTPQEGQDIRSLKTALDDQLRSVIKDSVNETEVREAISRMRTQVIYARDSLSGPAMIFGQALATGSTIDDVEFWDYDIQTVTAAQIQDVVTKYLNPDDAVRRAPVTGYLLPAASAETSPTTEASPATIEAPAP